MHIRTVDSCIVFDFSAPGDTLDAQGWPMFTTGISYRPIDGGRAWVKCSFTYGLPHPDLCGLTIERDRRFASDWQPVDADDVPCAALNAFYRQQAA